MILVVVAVGSVIGLRRRHTYGGKPSGQSAELDGQEAADTEAQTPNIILKPKKESNGLDDTKQDKGQINMEIKPNDHFDKDDINSFVGRNTTKSTRSYNKNNTQKKEEVQEVWNPPVSGSPAANSILPQAGPQDSTVASLDEMSKTEIKDQDI